MILSTASAVFLTGLIRFNSFFIFPLCVSNHIRFRQIARPPVWNCDSSDLSDYSDSLCIISQINQQLSGTVIHLICLIPLILFLYYQSDKSEFQTANCLNPDSHDFRMNRIGKIMKILSSCESGLLSLPKYGSDSLEL